MYDLRPFPIGAFFVSTGSRRGDGAATASVERTRATELLNVDHGIWPDRQCYLSPRRRTPGA